jgi:hypothetical protein
MQKKITNASADHLLKPEGRQMFLRIFDPLLQQCVDSITGIQSMIIPLFVNCLKSREIIAIINTAPVGNVEDFIKYLKENTEEKKFEKHPVGGMYFDLKKKLENTIINTNPMVAFNPIKKRKVKETINKMILDKVEKDDDRKYYGGKKSRNQKYLPKKQNTTRKRK